jgi:hypothetical protein
MKHVFFVTCTAIALAIGVARCGHGDSLRNQAQGGACETSCKQAQDKCTSECSGTNADGTAKDSAACNLGCTEAKDKCNSDCKSR